MATFNITITDPQEIQRLEDLLKELSSAQVYPIASPDLEQPQSAGYYQHHVESGQPVATRGSATPLSNLAKGLPKLRGGLFGRKSPRVDQ